MTALTQDLTLRNADLEPILDLEAVPFTDFKRSGIPARVKQGGPVSCEHIFHHAAVDVRQAVVATLEAERKSFVVKA